MAHAQGVIRAKQLEQLHWGGTSTTSAFLFARWISWGWGGWQWCSYYDSDIVPRIGRHDLVSCHRQIVSLHPATRMLDHQHVGLCCLTVPHLSPSLSLLVVASRSAKLLCWGSLFSMEGVVCAFKIWSGSF